MPTKASRARRWINKDEAIPKWDILGIFYVQLKVNTENKRQEVVLGLDTGAKFDGVTIVSKKRSYTDWNAGITKENSKENESKKKPKAFQKI